jgi:DNA-binding transcriptional LysR family regulator
VRDTGQLLQLVALGQVVAVLPESVRTHARADVVCVPLLDAPQTSVLLAWPERTTSRAVAAFVRAGTEIAQAATAAADTDAERLGSGLVQV